MVDLSQRLLDPRQLEAFYHSQFVTDQIAHFRDLVGSRMAESALQGRNVVLDLGGGVGHFAQGLQGVLKIPVRVVDVDPVSVAKCHENGIKAILADVTEVPPDGDEAVVCFNLILHHLVGRDARSTRKLQQAAISRWSAMDVAIFVNEYIYESYVPGFSGRFIYAVTSSAVLSGLARAISRVVPSLRANTFGVGVRFRGENEWIELFRAAGYGVEAMARGQEEKVSFARRLLLIRGIRRTSFLLRPLDQGRERGLFCSTSP